MIDDLPLVTPLNPNLAIAAHAIVSQSGRRPPGKNNQLREHTRNYGPNHLVFINCKFSAQL